MPELTPDTTTRREFFDANREILTWLRTHRHTSNYLRSLAEAYEDTGILTPRQLSSIRAARTRRRNQIGSAIQAEFRESRSTPISSMDVGSDPPNVSIVGVSDSNVSAGEVAYVNVSPDWITEDTIREQFGRSIDHELIRITAPASDEERAIYDTPRGVRQRARERLLAQREADPDEFPITRSSASGLAAESTDLPLIYNGVYYLRHSLDNEATEELGKYMIFTATQGPLAGKRLVKKWDVERMQWKAFAFLGRDGGLLVWQSFREEEQARAPWIIRAKELIRCVRLWSESPDRLRENRDVSAPGSRAYTNSVRNRRGEIPTRVRINVVRDRLCQSCNHNYGSCSHTRVEQPLYNRFSYGHRPGYSRPVIPTGPAFPNPNPEIVYSEIGTGEIQ